ncbi:MAG: hypothetical protein EXR47_07735 [Dehalococcoidia bacterium]|nr:hypothetical protein [Dehalococcoidia bacterium]
MTVRSGGVTIRLLEKLLRDQERRAKRERKLPFAKKLEVLDGMWESGLTQTPAKRRKAAP